MEIFLSDLKLVRTHASLMAEQVLTDIHSLSDPYLAEVDTLAPPEKL